jgi:hypothetical protein
VRIACRALVVTAWVKYEPAGVLHYDEFMCAVLVRPLRAHLIHVTNIWVNNKAAAAGGRELWGVPKQLGEFVVEQNHHRFQGSLSADGRDLAQLQFERTLSIPGRFRLKGLAAQMLGGAVKKTRLQAHGHLHLGRARWQFKKGGPLEYLTRTSPVLSFQLSNLQLRFGSFLASPS